MKLHQLEGYIQDIHLVEYKDKLMLLDGCCRCDVNVVEKYIVETLKRDPRDLKLVLVTHMHPDHCGGATFFRAKFGTKIAAVEGADNWYIGIGGILTYLLDIFLTHYVAKKKKKKRQRIIFPRKIRADLILENHKEVPGFKDWKVISTPGHTDSDISIYNQSARVCYIADNIIRVRRHYIVPYPVNYPDLYIKTLELYKKMDIRDFLLAHGGKVQLDNEQIDEIINIAPTSPSNHKQLLKRLFKNVRKNNYFSN